MSQSCPRLAHPPQPFSLFCFLSLVPPVHADLSCVPCCPMSVSAAATALYKSLPWQPAVPRLFSVISPGDTHSLWQAFTLPVYKSWCDAALPCRQNPMHWFSVCWRVLVNLLFAWKDCLLHLAREERSGWPGGVYRTRQLSVCSSWREEAGCCLCYRLIWNSVIRSENGLWLEVSSTAPLGITPAVPSCCFVFFLYPFNTSPAVLGLLVEEEKNNNLSGWVSVWIRQLLHFSALNCPFSTFHTTQQSKSNQQTLSWRTALCYSVEN